MATVANGFAQLQADPVTTSTRLSSAAAELLADVFDDETVAASTALDRFADFSATWEQKYPAIMRLWTNAWAEPASDLPKTLPTSSLLGTLGALDLLIPRWQAR